MWPVILISPLLLIFLFLLISLLLFEEPLRFFPLLAHKFCPDRNFYQFTAARPAEQSVACEGWPLSARPNRKDWHFLRLRAS